MTRKLKSYILCFMNESKGFTKTEQQFRARDSLAAAKKAYRINKHLKDLYILDVEEEQVSLYATSTFFTVKKEHKLNRNKI